MTSIETLLHRRTDLSTFLVHFTRDYGDADARTNLISILQSRKLEARTAFGMAAKLSGVAASQRTVCFSEAPLEQVWTLCQDIDGRGVALSSYGLVFTKAWARRRGCNPVWYLDQTPGHNWLTKPVEALTRAAGNDPDAPILKLTPFVEQMGPWKEFWWEREWRHVGDRRFAHDDVVAVLAPSADHASLSDELRQVVRSDLKLAVLDPEWGMERMIAALAGVPDSEAGPLPR